MKDIKRIILIVLDSLGVGALPDADLYGDTESNTLAHIAEAVGGIHLPHLEALGLGNLGDFRGINKVSEPCGSYGLMTEVSAGKDSITGHWELMGLILKEPFPTFPQGFPDDLINAFCEEIGTKIIGNCSASGTEIINSLGQRHMETGCPIVYTSVDSVFQIAAHEEVIEIDRLYSICKTARRILKGPYGMVRVIARPFVGKPGLFRRTERRRDFSLAPPEPTLLDHMKEAGIPTVGVGKIGDIFAERGLSKIIHSSGNDDGISKTLEEMRCLKHGLILTNLIDFDMLYGHRNDVKGYANALEAFDQSLPSIFTALRECDILIITADHGCDPTTLGTDHSREYVPLLIYGSQVKAGTDIGTRQTFADLGQTIAEIFRLKPLKNGTSFKKFL